MDIEKPSDRRISVVFSAYRLGKNSNNSSRPIRLTLPPDLKRQVMQKAPLLKDNDNTKNIYINHDLTISQSRSAFLVRQQQKNESEEERAANSDLDAGGVTTEVNQIYSSRLSIGGENKFLEEKKKKKD